MADETPTGRRAGHRGGEPAHGGPRPAADRRAGPADHRRGRAGQRGGARGAARDRAARPWRWSRRSTPAGAGSTWAPAPAAGSARSTPPRSRRPSGCRRSGCRRSSRAGPRRWSARSKAPRTTSRRRRASSTSSSSARATPWSRSPRAAARRSRSSALEHARRRGARAIAITCAPGSPLAKAAEIAIVAVVGPEVIAGSTRMKGGLAQKMILHTLSTAVMVRLGRVQGNLMTGLLAVNSKLQDRGVRILCELTGRRPRRRGARARGGRAARSRRRSKSSRAAARTPGLEAAFQRRRRVERVRRDDAVGVEADHQVHASRSCRTACSGSGRRSRCGGRPRRRCATARRTCGARRRAWCGRSGAGRSCRSGSRGRR